LNGLKKSVEKYLTPPREWQRVKDAGCALFDPGRGGRYEVFEHRPLDRRIVAYCAQDVTLLFQLEDALKRKMGDRAVGRWENRIIEESAERVKVAYDRAYVPNGRHKALSPLDWSFFLMRV
jgi:exonuclease 3'-5' domain-containing protein 1